MKNQETQLSSLNLKGVLSQKKKLKKKLEEYFLRNSEIVPICQSYAFFFKKNY